MERPTDIFLIVVVVTVGGIALFAGYRMGVKDGHQGGVHLGRRIERAQIERETRYLAPPVQGYVLESRPEPLALPMPVEAHQSQAEDAWHASEPFDYVAPAPQPDAWHASQPFEIAGPVSDADDQSNFE